MSGNTHTMTFYVLAKDAKNIADSGLEISHSFTDENSNPLVLASKPYRWPAVAFANLFHSRGIVYVTEVASYFRHKPGSSDRFIHFGDTLFEEVPEDVPYVEMFECFSDRIAEAE